MSATNALQNWTDATPTVATAGDTELLRRFVEQRDAAAMTAIVARHGPLVMGLCRSILRNEADAADAFQTTFLVLLKNAASIGKPASLASWLHGVACRVAIRARSQATQRHQHEMAGAAMRPDVPPSADAAADAETVRLIHEELCELPERLRLPLILCCLQGESREEAARQLGWSVGSLKGRLERAREMLQQRLSRRGVVLSMTALSGLLVQQASAQVPAALAAATVDSLVLAAAGKSIIGGAVSANTAALSKGVLISMKVAKLKTTALVVAGLCFVTGSTVVIVWTVDKMLEARTPPAQQPAVMTYVSPVNGAGLAVGGAYSAPPANPVRDRAKRSLQAIGLAMHNYHDQHNSFPSPATYRADGTPLLSWRVALLPYVDQAALYAQFHHDEPWDSPHNLTLLEKMPVVYDSDTIATKRPGETVFQVFTGSQAIFDKGVTRSIREIADGTSLTILVVDAATAVPWTKPEDLSYDPNQPLPPLGGIMPEGYIALLADGGTRLFSRETSEQTIRAMITASGGEPVNP